MLTESGQTLKLKISATVPIVCNTSKACSILVQMTTDKFELLLSVCMLEFNHGAANQTQIVQVAAKRDFVLDGTHMVKLRLNVSGKGAPVGWSSHDTIQEVLVCLFCFI